MGVFIFPAVVYAGSDTIPPVVNASIIGGSLRIEAADSDSGVEAVFINGKRVNYRVDNVLNVDARDYADDIDKISVYAVDFAGNESDAVTLDNPYYIAPEQTAPASAETPPAQSNPFTPDGQAGVLDQASNSDGKDFYSFTTQAGSIFYLIIDHQRTKDNVYFLNPVTENDLLTMADNSNKKGGSILSSLSSPAPATEKPVETSKPDMTKAPDSPPAKSGGNNSMMIFVIIGALSVGGIGYYVKIVRPKQQRDDSNEDLDEDDGEEMEFEDEKDEGKDGTGADDE